ncbi:hypothetical protein ABZ260_44825 [Streptosporangium sp. NPDC006013]|uniref:hypothetical protein n=1 Tax=Streptosporangium sp. NPDC006013 TaxID=3155596 RepID=UPI0033BCB7F3
MCRAHTRSSRYAVSAPSATSSVGGLIVDKEFGETRREDGTTIRGLYAADRDAVGICSLCYVGGLSLADCVLIAATAADRLDP